MELAFYGCTRCGRYLLGNVFKGGYTCVECSTAHRRVINMERINKRRLPAFEATLRLGGRDGVGVLLRSWHKD